MAGQLQELPEAVRRVTIVLHNQDPERPGPSACGRSPMRRFGRSRGGRRQAERELRAPPGTVAVSMHLPTVELHDALHQRQAEAQSSATPVETAFSLREAFKQAGKHL